MPRIRILEDIPMAKWGSTFGSPNGGGDPDDDWIRKIMEYEAKQGGYNSSTGKAYGLSNWGYNAPKGYYNDNGVIKKYGTNELYQGTGKFSDAPTSIDEAVARYKKEYFPDIQSLPVGMRERAGDFMYNTGRDYRVYMLDQYLKSKGQAGLADRSSYNKSTQDPNAWTPALSQKFENEWNKYKTDIENLPIEQRVDLLDKGKDFYYQNIDQVGGKPNPAYNATWKGRLGIFGPYSAPASNNTPPPVVNNTPPNVQVQTTPTTTAPPLATPTTTAPPAANSNDEPTPEQQAYLNKIGANIIRKKKAGFYDATENKPNIREYRQPGENYGATNQEDNRVKNKVSKRYVPTRHFITPQYYSTVYGSLDRLFNRGTSGYTGTGLIGPSMGFANGRARIKSKTSEQILNEWNTPEGYQEPVYNEIMRKQQNKSPIQSPIDLQRMQDLQNMYPERNNFSSYAKYGGLVKADFGLSVNNSTTTTAAPLGAALTTTTTAMPTGFGITPTTTAKPTNPFSAYKDTEFGKAMKQFGQTGFGKKMTGLADTINMGVATVAPLVDFFNQRNIQKEQNEQQQEGSIAANLYGTRPAGMTGNRGDWEINEGDFRLNERFGSKGQYVNPSTYPVQPIGYRTKYGGSINNNMEKIRIRILSDDLDHMAAGGQTSGYKGGYSGQYGYGLNLNQRKVYTEMPKNKSEQYSKTLQPVSRNEANIEAEKHEVAWGDIDADGAVEAMVIGGKRHTEGGTPLSVPEGTFIFSDTKDMRIKDEKTLKIFGLSPRKEGYTPAEIAKRYDVNKYKAILEDPNADDMKKATAQLMIKSYFKKLAQLALIQEQMKGFPQGIPEMAKKYLPELANMQQPTPGGQEPNGVQEYPEGQEPQEGQPQQGPQEEMMESPEQQSPQEEGQEQPQGMYPSMQRYGGSYAYGGSFDIGGSYFNVSNTTTAPPIIVGATTVSKQRAPITDPEYTTFVDLLKKYNDRPNPKKPYDYHISAVPDDKADEFLRYINKFGFSAPSIKDNAGKITTPGFNIQQGFTSGYGIYNKATKKTEGYFFGGLTPEMFEKKLLVDLYGDDGYAKMSPLERRKAYFKELGVDISNISDADLLNTKKLYNDKNFIENVYYPKFTQVFLGQDYRMLGNDVKFGFDHYDSYMKRQKVTPTTTAPPPGKYVCSEGGPVKYDPAIHGSSSQVYNSYEEAALACSPPPYTLIPPPRKRPINGYFPPDMFNLFAAAAYPPKKYLPWAPKFPFEPGDVVFKDWRAKAAERQSLMNRMMNQMNTFSPKTASGANASFLQGLQGEGVGSDIAQTDAENVAIANQFYQTEQARRDKNLAANLGVAEDLYKGNVIANQNFDNAQRAYLKPIGQAFGNLFKNKMYAGLMNAVNKYQLDPRTGDVYFPGGYGWGDLGTSVASSGGYSPSDYRKLKQTYMGYGYSEKEAGEEAIKVINGTSKSKDNLPYMPQIGFDPFT